MAFIARSNALPDSSASIRFASSTKRADCILSSCSFGGFRFFGFSPPMSQGTTECRAGDVVLAGLPGYAHARVPRLVSAGAGLG